MTSTSGTGDGCNTHLVLELDDVSGKLEIAATPVLQHAILVATDRHVQRVAECDAQYRRAVERQRFYRLNADLGVEDPDGGRATIADSKLRTRAHITDVIDT